MLQVASISAYDSLVVTTEEAPKFFLLTHLAFGMNMAPKIMTAIVQSVLGCNEVISTVSSSDDIIVAGGNMTTAKVKAHLESCGLQAKEPEGLGSNGGACVLGLRVEKGASGLVWKRDGQLPTLSTDCVMQHQLHSWIGELLVHYPVVGWLHTACGFLQHCMAWTSWSVPRCTPKPQICWFYYVTKVIQCTGAG